MKLKLTFFIAFFGALVNTQAQHVTIDQITATDVEGGVNINIAATSTNGAGYVGSVYSPDGSTINMTVCYWFNALTVITPLSNDIFVEIPHGGNYTLNVLVVHSTDPVDCDYFSAEPLYTTSFLSNTNFSSQGADLTLYPNPTTGKVAFKDNDVIVKSVRTFDQLGRLVQTNTERDIDFSALENGIYLVSIETGNGRFSQKIVVKK